MPANDQSRRMDFSQHHIQDWIFPTSPIPEKEIGVAILIRLSSRGVMKCRSDSWFSQELTILEDGTGRIERTILSSDVPCLIDTIITYGADAVLEQPVALRHTIIARMNVIRQLYSSEA